MTGTCPGCEKSLVNIIDGRAYNLEVGIIIDGVYDGALFWECPYCGHRMHRFVEGTRQHTKAIPYVTGEL